MRTTRKRAFVALAAIGALLTVAGVAYATIPDSNGTIHGCYAKDGAVRVVDTCLGQSCDPKKETALDWNAQGPAGPAGPAGQTGPAGPQGPAGAAHGYETNAEAWAPVNHLGQVISIGGLPDGTYMVWAQINAFGNAPPERLYCGLRENGTDVGYDVQTDLAGTNMGTTADQVIVGAVTVTGGNSTVDVECEAAAGSDLYTLSALSLIPVTALN